MSRGSRRGEPHAAAALRAHRADMRLEAVLVRERGAVVGHRERQEMVLDVGIAARPARLRMKPPVSKWLVAPSPSLDSSQRAPISALREQAHRRIERDRLRAGHLEIELEMVLQVLADAGQVVHDRDAVLAQARRPGPMPESFSSCGELIEPARQDHLAPRAHGRSRRRPGDSRRRWRACPRTGCASRARACARRGSGAASPAADRHSRRSQRRPPPTVMSSRPKPSCW